MLPNTVSGDDAKHWRVVRLDTGTDIPGELVSADVDAGLVVVNAMDQGEMKEVKTIFPARGIAIVARMLVLGAALAIGLSACSQINMKLKGDITNATWLAQNGGDTTGATCLAALGPPFATTPTPANDAVVATAERLRLLQMAVKKPECAQVIAPMLLQIEAQALPAPIGGILGAFSGS